MDIAASGIHFINAYWGADKEKLFGIAATVPDKTAYKTAESKRTLTNRTLTSLSLKTNDGYSYLSIAGERCKIYRQDDIIIVETIYTDTDDSSRNNLVVYLIP